MSLRRLSFIAASIFCLGAGVIAASLMHTMSALHRATETATREAFGMELASTLETELVSYQRVSNLVVATGQSDLIGLRSSLREELRRLIAQAVAVADTPTESRLTEDAGKLINEYVTHREDTERLGLTLEVLLVRMRDRMDAALRAVQELRMHHTQVAHAALARAAQLDRMATVMGLTISLAGLGIALVLLLAVRKYLYLPILSIASAVARFHRGDATARAEERAPAELQRLSHAFNQLAAQLVRQRAYQLEFLAGVVHDIRNPLSTFQLALDTLVKDPTLGEASHRSLLRMQRQLWRLDRMSADLLDASRIEAGHLELRLETYDLRASLQEAAQLYDSLSPAHNIHLSLPDEPVLVQADPTRIQQVIGNLISNSIKYSPSGGPVEVTVIETAHQARISVSDRGIGIAADEIEDIFVPFRRSKNSRNSIPGTGLGLSVVRRIVRAHGGEIGVKSTLGVGSTFSVELPRVAPAAAVGVPVKEGQEGQEGQEGSCAHPSA